jgi:hypothetical protein
MIKLNKISKKKKKEFSLVDDSFDPFLMEDLSEFCSTPYFKYQNPNTFSVIEKGIKNVMEYKKKYQMDFPNDPKFFLLPQELIKFEIFPLNRDKMLSKALEWFTESNSEINKEKGKYKNLIE